MISVLTPTHQRPFLARRMLHSLFVTSDSPVEAIFWVDGNDRELHVYRELIKEDEDYPMVSVKLMTGPSDKVGVLWNRMLRESNGHWIMMGNDDLIFRSGGWSSLVEMDLDRTFPDRVGVGYCHDGGPNAATQCAFPIAGRGWTDILGYFTPEHFHFLWNDTWVRDIAKTAKRLHYIPEILVEHCHFTYKKAEMDDTYLKHRTGDAKEKRAEDERRYRDLENVRLEEARKILEASR